MLKPRPKKKPWRSEKYRRFVASLNCCITNSPAPNDSHHHQSPGSGSMGGKIGDERCVPLVRFGHRILHSHGRGIWEKWGVDPEEIITRTQAEWVRRGGKREWESQ